MDYVTRQFINLTKKFRKELRQVLQNQTNAIGQATKAARENKQQPLPVPLPVLAELKIPETDKTEQRTQYNRSHTLQIWLTVGTWLAFIAAAIYAGIAARQLWQMKRATYAAEQAANAAKSAAETASQTLISNMSNFHTEQRPYVNPENIRFDPALEQAHDPATIKIDFHNAGRTPALKATFTLDAFVDGKKTVQQPRDFPSELMIPSDRISGTSMNLWIKTPGDFEGIIAGTKHLSIKGVIHYTDIFKEWHPTTFCAVYDARVTKLWVYCPGNDIK
jgi:type II secretory pathway pseudopilin PulG